MTAMVRRALSDQWMIGVQSSVNDCNGAQSLE